MLFLQLVEIRLELGETSFRGGRAGSHRVLPYRFRAHSAFTSAIPSGETENDGETERGALPEIDEDSEENLKQPDSEDFISCTVDLPWRKKSSLGASIGGPFQ